uniref:Putative secreted protein n=1 Tax=Ixodes ricinus TaxID=34613 RepID=V5HBF7_IXORI
MLLTLVLIVQICSTVHGYKEIGNNIIKLKINTTCVAYREKVSRDWTVAKGCYMTCSPNGTDVSVEFPDERLCAVQLLQSGGYSPLSITGKCYNGTCMRPELAPMPTKSGPFCSPPETTLHEEENIATECTHRCFEESPPRLTYGRMKYNVTNGVKCLGKNRKVGTCQYGTCSGPYQEGECKRKMLAVYSRTNVVEKCMLRCNNGSYIQVENGTMCALRTPN